MMKNFCKKILSFLNIISNNTIGNNLLYVIRTKSIPNYKKPKKFNDKTMILKKTYKNNELIVNCTDKYNVREYINDIGCKEILNDLYFVYDTVSDIDFDMLPKKFVLKCTHGCGYNIICKDKEKFDVEKAKKKLNKWMHEKYGYATGELHYTKIKPRIICEKYIEDGKDKMLTDYKFYCFDGICKGILVCTEREKELKLNFFDTNWNELDYIKGYEKGNKIINKPNELKKMIEYAEILSKKFKFVRVDLYDIKGKIILGELTFTPACCCAPYYNEKGNILLGKELKL